MSLLVTVTLSTPLQRCIQMTICYPKLLNIFSNVSIKYNNLCICCTNATLCLQEQDYYRFLCLCSKNFYRSHHTNQFQYLAQKTQQNHARETKIITMLGIVSTSLASQDGTLYWIKSYYNYRVWISIINHNKKQLGTSRKKSQYFQTMAEQRSVLSLD